MKQRLFKIIAMTSVLMLLVSMSGIGSVFADETTVVSRQCDLTTVLSTEQKETSFVISSGINKGVEDGDNDANVDFDDIFSGGSDGDNDANVDFGDIFDIALSVKFYISFPKEGGFRLRLSEEADKSGYFNPSKVLPITYVTLDDGSVKMSAADSADNTVVIFKDNGNDGFTLSVADGNKDPMLTLSSKESFELWFDGAYEVQKCRIITPLKNGEAIYAGGERFNAFNQVGTTFSLTNVDAAYNGDETVLDTSNKNHTKSYLNVPIFHSSEGYTIWYNMTYTGEASVGDAEVDPSNCIVSFDGGKLDFYVFTGKVLDNVKKYTALTGTSIVPPKWAFGYWLGGRQAAWRKDDTLTDAEELLAQLQRYNDLGITISAVYAEDDNTVKPDFQNLLNANVAYEKYKSVKMLTWYGAYGTVANTKTWLDAYQTWSGGEAIAYENYPYPKLYSDPTQFNLTGTKIGHDYSHPNAYKMLIGRLSDWYANHNVRGAMVDFGELYPLTDSLSYDRLLGDEMRNFNAYYYAKASKEAFDALQRGNDTESTAVDADYILFARSGAAGSQQFVGNFLGDQASTWTGMKDQLYAMLSMGVSGYNIYGGDLGGHTSHKASNMYHRWLQLSTFSPLMRVHNGAANLQNPWDYSGLAEISFQQYYWLRQNLQDALYSASVEANLNATPMVQALGVAYQGQAGVKTIDNQYLFCNNLLVAPVVDAADGSVNGNSNWYRDIRLPEGMWYNLWTGDRVEGNRVLEDAEAPLTMIPVYIKSGAVIPVDLPASMQLMEKMDGTKYKGLVVTPPDNLTNSTVHFNDDGSDSITYTSNYVSDRQFIIEASKSSDVKCFVAYGVNAVAVTVDGVALTKSDSKLTPGTTSGFYTDDMGHSYIVLPSDITSWNEIVITGKDNVRQQLTLKTPTASYISYANMVDGNVTTAQDYLGQYRETLTVNLQSASHVDYVEIGWADTDNSNNNNGEYTVSWTASNGASSSVKFSKRGCLQRVPIGATISSFTIKTSYIDGGTISTNNTTATIYEIRAFGAPVQATSGKVELTNGSVTIDTAEKTITVAPNAGYQLKTGSLRALTANGTVVPLTRVGSPDAGAYDATGGDVYTYDSNEAITVSAQFYQPNKTILNAAVIGTQVNPSKNGLRFVYRVNRTVDSDGKMYIAVKNEDGTLSNLEIKDYGILFALDKFVGNETLTVDKAKANQYIKNISLLNTQNFKYRDYCDQYVEYSVQITGLSTTERKTTDITANAYVQLMDGTYLYANGYTTTYEAAQ